MNPNAPRALFAVLMSLAIAAVGVTVVDAPARRGQPAKVEEFQRLVRGLGFGPATDLSRCEFSFDPRLSGNCSQDLGPIPGGVYFCPHHACSIMFYRQPIDQLLPSHAKAERDAEVP